MEKAPPLEILAKKAPPVRFERTPLLQSNPALQRTPFENTPVFDKLVVVTAPKNPVPP